MAHADFEYIETICDSESPSLRVVGAILVHRPTKEVYLHVVDIPHCTMRPLTDGEFDCLSDQAKRHIEALRR